MKKTKIIATIGPTCEKASVLEGLVKAGVDVCRLNFSFGTHDEHLKKIKRIRDISAKTGKSVAILQDLQGPKIRVGKLNGPVDLKRGDTVTLSGKDEHKEKLVIPTTYSQIASDTEPGKTILVADGKIILRVEETDPRKKAVVCKVINGGTVLTGKGINLPYTDISLPALTPKDVEDAVFGMKAGVDYIGMSFVRKPQDITKLRKLMKKENVNIPIIAKIEKPEALDNLDEILELVDGVMVARGDLADEISFAKVPAAQKTIIRKANLKGKITIIATEMLSSMVENPLPTRAEVSDVANGVLDGADCLMLSNETAMGRFPLKSVKAMASIIKEGEGLLDSSDFHKELDLPEAHKINEAMCEAASFLSYDLQEKAVCVITTTGETPRIISKYRPDSTIYAATVHEDVYWKMAFYHNVFPILLPGGKSTEKDIMISFRILEEELKKRKLARKGDRLIVLAGINTSGDKWNLNSLTVNMVS